LILTQLRPEAETELKALVRRRRQLLAMLGAETNQRLHASKVIRKSIVVTIRGLKRALAEREVQVKREPQALAGAAEKVTAPAAGSRPRSAVGAQPGGVAPAARWWGPR
jgi:hypothetical protein